MKFFKLRKIGVYSKLRWDQTRLMSYSPTNYNWVTT